MMIARSDKEILFSDEVIEMHEKYREKFGQSFIGFSYGNFTSAERYKEALAKALLDDKPSALKYQPDDISKSWILYYVIKHIQSTMKDPAKVFSFCYSGKKGFITAHSESDFDMRFDGASMKAHSLDEVIYAPFFNGQSLEDIVWDLEYDWEPEYDENEI